jgi:hypothetical protein
MEKFRSGVESAINQSRGTFVESVVKQDCSNRASRVGTHTSGSKLGNFVAGSG